MLRAKDGRPRLSVVSIAHLSDEERLFVVALLLDKVKTWMRRQPGTSALRALVYMDEVFGFFPPTANPPTKRPMLTLLKQARAQGVGVVLATQNPVDLDYKGLANMGTWMVGTLQTQRDRERLSSGLTGAGLEPAKVEALLDATRKRVFLLHDVHRKEPALLESRFAMSYLRGPLTRDEIARLMDPVEAAQRAAAPAGAAPARGGGAGRRPAGPAGAVQAPLPAEVRRRDRRAARAREVRGAVQGSRRDGRRARVAARRGDRRRRARGRAVRRRRDGGRRDGAGRPALLGPAGVALRRRRARESRRPFATACPTSSRSRCLHDPVTDETSRPGETRDAFAARLTAEGGGDAAAKLRERLEKKRQDLAVREQEVAGRRQEKWMAVGSAVLRNIGLLTGRKRSVAGVSSVLSKNRMEGTAEARLEALQAEVAELEQQLAAATQVDPARLEEQALVPARGGVKLLRCDFLWVY